MTAKDRIENAGYEDIILLDDSCYDDALIGVTCDGRAVYDFEKMVIGVHEADGVPYDNAMDWVNYNTILALDNAGDKSPIVMYPLMGEKTV